MIAALAAIHIMIHDERHGGVRHINNRDRLPVINLGYTGAHYSAYRANDLTHLGAARDKVIRFDR